VKLKEVEVGKTYAAKISERVVPVTIVSTNSYGGWNGRNERTGRSVRIRGAAKLRFELVKDGKLATGNDRWRRADRLPKPIPKSEGQLKLTGFWTDDNSVPPNHPVPLPTPEELERLNNRKPGEVW
jgi:hypothetical protein